MGEDVQKICLRRIADALDNIDFHQAAPGASFTIERAILFELLVIGELAMRLSSATLERMPHIPWKEIKGMRAHLAHQHHRLNYEIIWNAIDDQLPKLRKAIQAYMEI